MIVTRLVIPALATFALFSFAGGSAQAQFGPMGMGMRGPMGMGMMGMMRGPMGMGRRAFYDDPPVRYRRSHRLRDYYEDDEPPSHHGRSKAKQAAPAAKPAAAQVISKPAVVPAQNVPQTKPVQTQQAHVNQSAGSQPQVHVVAPVKQEKATTEMPTPAPASTDSALPVRLTPENRPLNCMTKLHLKDGTVLLQDFCTLEEAVIKQPQRQQQQQQAAPQQQQQQPQQQKSQTPAQLARSR